MTKGKQGTNHSETVTGSSALISGPEWELSRAALALQLALWLLNEKETIFRRRAGVPINDLFWVGIPDHITPSPVIPTLIREVLWKILHTYWGGGLPTEVAVD